MNKTANFEEKNPLTNKKANQIDGPSWNLDFFNQSFIEK